MESTYLFLDVLDPIPPLPSKPPPSLIFSKKDEGTSHYLTLKKQFESEHDADREWLVSMVRSGTANDVISALTLMVQNMPFFGLEALNKLLKHAKKKSRAEATSAVYALKDLFLSNMLPDRKLKDFHDNPIGGEGASEEHYASWYYEGELKKAYSKFVRIIEEHTKDTVSHFKNNMLKVAFDLLCEKPEMEQRLLQLIVNKLGDTTKKIASKASYLLTQLVEKHPNMKVVVVKEINNFLHRPNLSERAQYYSVIFLNQIVLSNSDSELSDKLLEIYFDRFSNMIGDLKGKELAKGVSSKMLSALLTGVNRAFPFAPKDQQKFNDHMDTLFKVVHVATFNKAVQALLLVWQVMHAQKNVTSRFYRALYEKILSPELCNTSKLSLFINVLFRALINDPNMDRITSFVKRLLHFSLIQKSNFTCAVLLMLSELLKRKPQLRLYISREEPTSEFIKENSSIVAEYFEKEDQDFDDSEEFEKISHMELYEYYPGKRDPLYAQAINSCLWELQLLSQHFHPSVSKWASYIIKGEDISYSGDPLLDFDLSSFLDRISFKNPKKLENQVKEKTSVMENQYIKYVDRTPPVTSQIFLKKQKDQVREDEIYFYEYFKGRPNKTIKKKKKSDKEAEAHMSDDEIDELIRRELENEFNELEEENSGEAIDENIFTSIIQEDQAKKEKISIIESDESEEKDENPHDLKMKLLKKYISESSDEGSVDPYDAILGEDVTEDSYEMQGSISKLYEELAFESSVESSDGELDLEGSVFAAADDFADMLADSGKGINPKQAAWEKRTLSNKKRSRTDEHHNKPSKRSNSNRGRGRGRGNRGRGRGRGKGRH